mmetsp:Transcript_31122/g.73988  ORF Transcript_31122/g.73988 Transcript_31122/m.73988 type:complete len:84 (-) Transcript_31122:2040-2291(-)
MFERKNAKDLLEFAFRDRLKGLNLNEVVDEFCSSYAPRQSKVLPEARAKMYADLQKELDQLPDCFVRRPEAASPSGAARHATG